MTQESQVHRLKDPEISQSQRILDGKNAEIKEIVEHYTKRRGPYKKWLQVNNSSEAYDAEDWLIENSPSAYRVLRFLTSNMDHYNAVICSYKVMQEKLNYSRTTIADAVRLLKECKYISVARTGGANIYMINKELYWNSWGSNYAYAEFGAKVVISSSEQDEETKKEIKTKIKKRQEVLLKENGSSAPPIEENEIEKLKKQHKK